MQNIFHQQKDLGRLGKGTNPQFIWISIFLAVKYWWEVKSVKAEV